MDILKIIGEAVGVIAIIEGFMVYFSKTREQILTFKFIADALWFINLILLGGYTGALLNLIAMGRETVFYHRDKKRWASHPLWLVLFLVITAISPTISLLSGKEGWYALFPAVGSMIAVVAFYLRNPAATRAVGFFSQALWLTYACFILNYSAIASNSVLLISAVAGSIRAALGRQE